MSVIVPSYAYTYIKIGFLKQLLIPSSQLDRLDKSDDIEELISTIKPYYPSLDIKRFTIDEIEHQLYHTYIKLIGKIMSYSPENLRAFLQDYLTQYEVMNVKQIILGTILGINTKEKRENVNFLVQKYLDREEFIEDLIKISSLDEIQLFLRNTKYNKPVREGLLSFRNKNEIFVLESFLDQLYYKTLTKERPNLNKYEKKMITLFTHYVTEIYNLRTIYRGIINNIDKNLLSQFLVEGNLFLDNESSMTLLNQTKLNDFFHLFNSYLRDTDELKSEYRQITAQMEHPLWEIEKMYQEHFFTKFELQVDNIDYSTLYRIFELVIKKEREIQFYILPNVIRILHNKFEKLKQME